MRNLALCVMGASRCKMGRRRIPPTLLIQMDAIAEWLICAFTAAAQSNTIANFIRITIGTFNQDASAYPERAAHTFVWVFYQPYGRFKFGLNLVTFFIPDNKTTGWAIARFFDSNSSGFRIIGLLSKLPYSARPVAEAGVNT